MLKKFFSFERQRMKLIKGSTLGVFQPYYKSI